MTNVSDSDIERVVVRRTYNVTREKIFTAWTKPDLVKQWFSPTEDIATPVVEIDLRVGGRYRVGFLKSGEEQIGFVTGEYREVQVPEKLVYTWQWDEPHQYAGCDTLVTVEFLDQGSATEVILTHEGISDHTVREHHTMGWNGAFDRLGRFI